MGQKMTADFKFCLKFHSFFFHEKQEGCRGVVARTAGQVTCGVDTLRTVKRVQIQRSAGSQARDQSVSVCGTRAW